MSTDQPVFTRADLRVQPIAEIDAIALRLGEIEMLVHSPRHY